MNSIVKLYTENHVQLNDFLEKFFSKKINIEQKSNWQKEYQNPVEMAEIIAAFIDNKNKYPQVNMWVSIDPGVFINIKEDNYNYFIQYLYERYPY